MNIFGSTRRKGAPHPTWRVSLIGLFVLAGCQVAPDDNLVVGTESTSTRTEVPSGPVILSFVADDTTIDKGQSTTLSWQVNDPKATLKIAPLAEVVEGSSKTVTPSVTTTYTLTAVNFMGTVSSTVTVSVRPRTSDSGTTPDIDAESEWVEATGNLTGLPSECGNLSFLAARQGSDTIIAGVALQGLWSSDSVPETWVPLGQDPGSATITHRLTSIVDDPDDLSVFWHSGMYSGGGVYRTDDNGVSFQQLGDVDHLDFVSVDLADPERRTLLAGAHEARNVFRSTDGGMTWVDVSGGLPRNSGFSTSGLVVDADTFLLGTTFAEGSGVFRTTDAGDTWEQVLTVGTFGVPLISALDGTIYWLLDRGQGMIKSSDDGNTWVKTGAGPSSTDSGSIQEMEDGRLLAVGGNHVIVSSDQGDTWDRLGPIMPYSANGIAYSPFRNAVYIWRWDCSHADDNSVASDAIMRLDLVSEDSEAEMSAGGMAPETAGPDAAPASTSPGTGAVATVAPVTIASDLSAMTPKVAWQGTSRYLHGANLPWYNWSCDFGCGDGSSGQGNGGVGVSDESVTRDIDATFAAAKAAGMNVVRWWVFPGDPWQVEVGADGLASGVDDAVYQDFDAALFLAGAHDIDLVFTIFSAPSAVPEEWLRTEAGRLRLADALAELFARYPDQVHTWQLFNEPEWEIWSEAVEEADVRAAVEAVAMSIRENSRSLVSIGSARLDALPMWIGAGLDYYTAHWYDTMGDGEACALCTTYPEVAGRYGLDAPLVIGEFYAGADPGLDGRFESLFDRGYAGGWGWSLLSDKTADMMDVDLAEAAVFAQERLAMP